MSVLPKLLIIDDDEDLAEVLADYLEDDFTSTVCCDPEKAMALLQKQAYDVVISDLHMPKVDGFAIIAATAASQPATPVILLTGSSERDPAVQEALRQGAKGIITKPFASPDAVLGYLKKFVA